MNSLITYLPLLLKGASVTIIAWCIIGVFSLLIGTLLGITSCNRSSCHGAKILIRLYTFIAKGVPAYVQILIGYFVIPQLLGITISGFAAACSALIFCASGYITEIIRSGINAISRGQWDACLVLGYPFLATFQRVIMPQAIKTMLLPLGGELEQLLKSTSLLATIGVMELTRSGINIISRELNPLPIYLSVACIYLVFSALLQLLLIYFEKKLLR